MEVHPNKSFIHDFSSFRTFDQSKPVFASVAAAAPWCSVDRIGAFDLGQVPVMLDENFTLFMKNLLIFVS